VQRELAQLADDPWHPGVTRLTGSRLWRARVGPIRIIYAIEASERLVRVLRVARCGVAYRNIPETDPGP
jgi:mRNA-degrading endonuclease RelE of RelBE toxin-antitoxin system